MTGDVKTSRIVDIGDTSIKENHLFKDDFQCISYEKKLKFEKTDLDF